MGRSQILADIGDFKLDPTKQHTLVKTRLGSSGKSPNESTESSQGLIPQVEREVDVAEGSGVQLLTPDPEIIPVPSPDTLHTLEHVEGSQVDAESPAEIPTHCVGESEINLVAAVSSAVESETVEEALPVTEASPPAGPEKSTSKPSKSKVKSPPKGKK